MTILTVVLPDSIANITFHPELELTDALIRAAPNGCEVHALTSALDGAEVDLLRARLPGLTRVTRSSLSARAMAVAWSLGIAPGHPTGMLHASSLMAPLKRHDRTRGDQVSVTVSDLAAWNAPSTLPAAAVAQAKALLRRARRFADAVVVPSHALASGLAEIVDLGDRIRVVPGAGRPFQQVADSGRRRSRLGLPGRYVLVDGMAPSELIVLVATVAEASPGVGVATWADTADEGSGVVHGDVTADADRFSVLEGASAYIAAEAADTVSLIDALSVGVPIIRVDSPSLAEIAFDASVVCHDGPDLIDELVKALVKVLSDAEFAGRLSIEAIDRSRAFSWRDAAERIWQLHADL